MNKQGQGLLEAIIATSILVVGISGVLGLSGNNLITSNISTQELLAINLAREGVEVITNIRDSNYIDNAIVWNNGIDSGSNNDDGIIEYNPTTGLWNVDFLSNNTTFSDSATIIYIDPTTGLYRQNSSVVSGWQATPYKRLININRICNSDVTNYVDSLQCSGDPVGYRILSQVQWDDHGNTRSVTIEKRIFNWR